MSHDLATSVLGELLRCAVVRNDEFLIVAIAMESGNSTVMAKTFSENCTTDFIELKIFGWNVSDRVSMLVQMIET